MILPVVGGFAAVVLLTSVRDRLPFRTAVHSPSVSASQDTQRQPSGTYHQAQAKVEAERKALLTSYMRATTSAEKEAVIDRAREVLAHSVNDLFEFWYGTPWDFYGTTETPGQGKIACGYFVTTVLRDVGLKVQRTKLAQQASENIIRGLTSEAHIKRYRLKAIGDFVEDVKKSGSGVYIVGLDIHVGFIINSDGEVYFVHSSYMNPARVVKERALGSTILAASKYRVLGKISANDELILKWLRGDLVTTRAA